MPTILPRKRVPEKVLGITALVAITFFNVSGGPFGSEEIISACGPAVGLSAIIIFSLIFSVPVILVTSELSSAFPNDGGYSIWVTEAFGEFWGIQESYWSLASGVVDNAVYPVLIADLAENLWPQLEGLSFSEKYGLKLGLAMLFAIPNFVSVRSVGHFLTSLSVIVALPFCYMIYLSIGHMELSRLGAVKPFKTQNWRQLLTLLYWNLNGYDCISTCAGQVRDPGRTIPRALFLAVALIACSYILPLAVAVAWTEHGVHDSSSWMHWTDGSLSAVGKEMGGPWLASGMVVAALVGNCGLFVAELFEDSFQLYGMAQVNLAPAVFGRLNGSLGTPVNSILFLLALIAVLILLDFSSILVVDNFFSCLSLLLELSAAIQLRRTMPESELHRPYTVPLGTTGLAVLLALPLSLGALVCLNELTKSWFHFFVNMSGLAGGVLIYIIYAKKKKIGYQTPRLNARDRARTVSEFDLYH